MPFASKDRASSQKTTLSTVCVQAEIQTRHIPNISEKHKHLCHLLIAICEHQSLNVTDDSTRYKNISQEETAHKKSKMKDWENWKTKHCLSTDTHKREKILGEQGIYVYKHNSVGREICYPSEFNYTVLCIYPVTRRHNLSIIFISS